jgi:hypothetical protein
MIIKIQKAVRRVRDTDTVGPLAEVAGGEGLEAEAAVEVLWPPQRSP